MFVDAYRCIMCRTSDWSGSRSRSAAVLKTWVSLAVYAGFIQ